METVLTKRKINNEFWRRFSCSETMLTLLNRASGNPSKVYEEAADPLNGGVLAELDGACGIFWGAALAAGIRAAAGIPDPILAAQKALEATGAVVDAYNGMGRPVDCRDITRLKKWNMPLFMAKGNISVCHEQMAKFAPQFHKAIDGVLQGTAPRSVPNHRNCAAEAYRLAAEILELKEYGNPAVVAGFAGGVGLSGNVCGAFAAVLFAMSVRYFADRGKPKHGMMRSNLQGLYLGDGWMNPLREVSRGFQTRMKGKKCRDITGRSFATAGDLSDFLNTGACDHVQEVLKDELIRGTD